MQFKEVRQAISYALEELKNKRLINDDEAKKLQELYEKDSRDIKEIFYEIISEKMPTFASEMQKCTLKVQQHKA